MKRDLLDASWLPEDFSVQIASAKRTVVERSGMHGWYPYYGGFSEAFVSSAISYLRATGSDVVLDPWAGSGTTGLVAARHGISSIGIEINPIMCDFAAAKSPAVHKYSTLVNRYLDDLDQVLAVQNFELEHPSQLFDSVAGSLFQQYLAAAPDFEVGVGDSLGAALKCGSYLDPIKAFLRAVAYSVLRRNVAISAGSNPTWTKVGQKVKLDQAEFLKQIRKSASAMLSDVEAYFSERMIAHQGILNADSRHIPLATNSVDVVITSPPYLTRLDYVVSTTPELLATIGHDAVRLLRYETMGSTLIRRGKPNVRDFGSRTCDDFLTAVRGHTTKAAVSYYLKNFEQYFADAQAVLSEIWRVCRTGARGLLVVQNSYFKEVECDLGKIYVEMAESLGFGARVLRRERVRVALANVNKRSQEHSASKQYYEDVVHFWKH